jgi:hypothetical protein
MERAVTREDWLRLTAVLRRHNVEIAEYAKVTGSGWRECRKWAHLPNGMIYRLDLLPPGALEEPMPPWHPLW